MLKVSEVYTSIQGEGPLTGDPTTFVRFGGCNMRCPGWPCDTMFAVDPKFQADWKRIGPVELMLKLTKPKHVCLTGGEPLMQKEADLSEFVRMLWSNGYKIEMFTNGSFEFPLWLHQYGVRIMMDWKLEGSGEANTRRDIRRANTEYLQASDGLKFVITNEHDLKEAFTLWKTERWLHDALSPQIWVGAAWDKISDQTLIDFILEKQLPWRLNVQVHKHLWDPNERRV